MMIGGQPGACLSNRAPADRVVPRKVCQPARPEPMSSISQANPPAVAVNDCSTALSFVRYGCQKQLTKKGNPNVKSRVWKSPTPGSNDNATDAAPKAVKTWHMRPNKSVYRTRSYGRRRNRT